MKKYQNSRPKNKTRKEKKTNVNKIELVKIEEIVWYRYKKGE